MSTLKILHKNKIDQIVKKKLRSLNLTESELKFKKSKIKSTGNSVHNRMLHNTALSVE